MASWFTCTAWSLPTMEESLLVRRLSRTKCCEQETDMCLAIPGKVVEVFDQQGMRMAKVQFGGIVREACLEYVPETQVGDYVLVHVGFAISRVDEEEAQRTYQLLEELDNVTEQKARVGDEIGGGRREKESIGMNIVREGGPQRWWRKSPEPRQT